MEGHRPLRNWSDHELLRELRLRGRLLKVGGTVSTDNFLVEHSGSGYVEHMRRHQASDVGRYLLDAGMLRVEEEPDGRTRTLHTMSLTILKEET